MSRSWDMLRGVSFFTNSLSVMNGRGEICRWNCLHKYLLAFFPFSFLLFRMTKTGWKILNRKISGEVFKLMTVAWFTLHCFLFISLWWFQSSSWHLWSYSHLYSWNRPNSVGYRPKSEKKQERKIARMKLIKAYIIGISIRGQVVGLVATGPGILHRKKNSFHRGAVWFARYFF